MKMHRINKSTLLGVILVAVTLWPIAGAATASLFTANDGGNKVVMQQQRIVYDISTIDHDSDYSKMLSDIYPYHDETGTYYYEAHGNATNGEGWRGFKSFHDNIINYHHFCADLGITGFSVLLNGSASTRNVIDLSESFHPMTNQTIFNLLTLKNSYIDSIIILFDHDLQECECASKIRKMSIFLGDTLGLQDSNHRSPVKLGLEYTSRFIECCQHQDFRLLRFVNHAVFRVELTPLSTMLSYGLFSGMMDKLISKNRQFVQKFNADCTIYIRLVNTNWENSIDKTNFARFEGVMARFFAGWYTQNTANETFIMRPPLKNADILTSNEFLKQSATAIVSDWRISSVFRRWYCDPPEALKAMQSIFNQFLLWHPSIKTVNFLVSSCNGTNRKATTLTLRDKSHFPMDILFDRHQTNMTELLKIANMLITSENHFHRIGTIYLPLPYLRFPKDGVSFPEFIGVINRLHAVGIQIGCLVEYDEFYPYTISTTHKKNIEHCVQRFNMSTHVLLHRFVNVPVKSDLLKFLVLIHQERQMLEQMYPGKIFDYTIEIQSVGAEDSFAQLRPSRYRRDRLYCDANLKLFNEYYQTIMYFAHIHKWKKLVVRPLTLEDDIGGWHIVRRSTRSFNPSISSFPLFLRSNSETPIKGILPMTYPCVQRLQSAEEAGINFLGNEHSGVTFTMKLRQNVSLDIEELKMALLFALDKFSSLLLIATNLLEFRQAAVVFSPAVLNAVLKTRNQLGSTSRPLLFIQVPLEVISTLPKGILLSIIRSNHIAVLVNKWEPHIDNLSAYHHVFNLSVGTEESLNFGIVVQNCDDEMNMGFSTIKKLCHFNLVKYVVCSKTLLVHSQRKQNKLMAQLTSAFHTKTYMENYLSTNGSLNGREVIFRINMRLESEECWNEKQTNEILVLLNHVNQHAAAYKIGYFMGSAFEAEHSDLANCPQSWWRIKNYSDLARPSVYVDKEDEYFDRATTLKIQFPIENDFEHEVTANIIFSKQYFYTAMSILAAVSFVTILVLLICVWRSRNVVLTSDEVRQFYNGGESSKDGMMMTSLDYHDLINMKFSEEYEIPLQNIRKGSIIGCGEFGLVHKGVLLDRGEVAIKMPLSTCKREHFKSTLSELKILCYIGAHQNIVSFLGASTREIRRGKLYIVTEYCEKGSLQSYLRKMQNTQIGNEEESAAVDINQLCLFSFQIACGMEYVAEKRIIHADLAARNVLLTSENVCKITDFGLSRRLYEMSEYVKKRKEPLPWRWMAPESLKNMQFSTKSDVWSYGVTLWEIYSLGMIPYTGRSWAHNFVKELDSGLRLEKAEHASDEIHEVMMDCWNRNQKERPSFAELRELFAKQRNDMYMDTDYKLA